MERDKAVLILSGGKEGTSAPLQPGPHPYPIPGAPRLHLIKLRTYLSSATSLGLPRSRRRERGAPALQRGCCLRDPDWSWQRRCVLGAPFPWCSAPAAPPLAPRHPRPVCPAPLATPPRGSPFPSSEQSLGVSAPLWHPSALGAERTQSGRVGWIPQVPEISPLSHARCERNLGNRL